MRTSLVLGCLLSGSLALGTASAARSTDLWPHEIIDAMDGQRLVLFLKDEEIAASPEWRPDQHPAPPMTIAEALKILKTWTARDARYEGARIHEIEIKPIHEHEREHRWYFLIQLRQRTGTKVRARYVAVMFNGTVVPVIPEPEAIK